MKLTAVRVTNFKSVLDSEWFSIGDLTCLVGKNESGKTAILEALEKLNSVRQGHGDLVETSYPRMNWSEYEESGAVDTALETKWELTDAEHAGLVEIAGDAGVITGRQVMITKDYSNKVHWIVPLHYGRAVEHAVDASGLTDAEKGKLAGIDNTTNLIKWLQEIEGPSARQATFLEELTERWGTGVMATVITYLQGHLPKLVYYDQYERLPGRISLNQFLSSKEQGTLDQIEGARVFEALLSMVGTTAEQINAISTSEELISKLEAVQTRLSQKLLKYWTQNRHIKVRFRFDQASPNDPAPYNEGKVFQTRIENTRHEATIRLDERSTGFIWFFSFLVWFSEVRRQFGENLIVLLDEPGLSLHARAQEDLLRYIHEELLPKYQVIYTTHSPFMVNASNLLDCRTVEDVTGPDDKVLGTKVGDKVFSTDADTLFPLQAALGYDLTQTLFVGEHCLLVEGPSDLLYLQWTSEQLRSLGRTALDSRWTVTPCGGITKVPSFVALFGGSNLHVAVLTDHGTGDKKKVRELRESDLLRNGHVFTADSYAGDDATEADVEDILGRAAYLQLVKDTYSLSAKDALPKARPEDAPIRVVAEVEQHFKTLPPEVPEFDHFSPARHLLENPSALGDNSEAALERFERLFVALNALL
jgi:hypothetical protein